MITAFRLLVVGAKPGPDEFTQVTKWPRDFNGVELLVCTSTRRQWQYESRFKPWSFLRTAADHHPQLTFVVDYDDGRTKGIACFKGRRSRLVKLNYRR